MATRLLPRVSIIGLARHGLRAAFLSLILSIGTASALAGPDVRIETPVNLIELAKDYFGIRDSVAPSTCKRRRATIDEIIVCGRDNQDQRIKPQDDSPFRLDPKQIAFSAPPPGAGTGVSVTFRACILQKCPKPILFIDVKSLPEAPTGSDADLIARGLAR